MNEAEVRNFEAETDKYIRETVFVVEASSYEQLMLWKEFSIEAKNKVLGIDEKFRRNFDSISLGKSVTVGKLDKRPIAICLNWMRIDGHMIMFWEATSQVVDYKKVEEWLENNVPAYKKYHRCNAMNFAHCMHHIRDLDEKSKST